MLLPILGIDVSKRKLHLALLSDEKLKRKTCDNSTSGFSDMLRWLGAQEVHACLEATGGYEEGVARALFEAGHRVSVVNPHTAHKFAQSLNARSKTDKIDAESLALYAQRNHEDLLLWQPPAQEQVVLQELIRRRESLVENRTQELNRLQGPQVGSEVRRSIEDHVRHLDAQIENLERRIKDHTDHHPGLKSQRNLLMSIHGIGLVTAAWFLAEVGPLVAQMKHPKQLLSYCGISLRRKESGTSVKGRPRMCKFGNSAMRTALFMPARTALWCNPVVVALGERLKQKGKPYKLRVGAAMRKLLHLMFGVLKHQQVFDPAYCT